MTNQDAKTLLDEAAQHPECDELMLRAPPFSLEALKAWVERERGRRAAYEAKR